MNKIFTFFSHWALCSRTPLYINDFKEIRHTPSVFPNGFFVKNKPGGVLLEYYNNQNVRIGYIRYYITTGQIGLFFIEDDYQHRGLGTQILSKVIEDLKKNHCEEVWAVTSEHHPFWSEGCKPSTTKSEECTRNGVHGGFWSNVYNKSFVYRHPAHPTVIGDGYFMKLNSYSS
jgi:hypothetical protein